MVQSHLKTYLIDLLDADLRSNYLKLEKKFKLLSIDLEKIIKHSDRLDKLGWTEAEKKNLSKEMRAALEIGTTVNKALYLKISDEETIEEELADITDVVEEYNQYLAHTIEKIEALNQDLSL